MKPLRRSKGKKQRHEAPAVLPSESTVEAQSVEAPPNPRRKLGSKKRRREAPVVLPSEPAVGVRRSEGPTLSLEQRLVQLLEVGRPLESLDVTLLEARGRLLAEDLVTDQPWPHFTSCVTDGYAARSVDIRPGNHLAVIGSISAGSEASAAVGPGKVIQVGAGATLPAVADAVLPLPSAAGVGNDQIQVRQRVRPGTGVLLEGAYAPKGKLLISKNSTIDERVVGVLAGIGRSRVSVVPRPRVVIVSVGAGLMADGAPPTPGKTYDSGNILLASATKAAGALSYRIGPIGEDLQLVADTLDDQLVRADVIVVCGGVASKSDAVRNVLSRIGRVSYDDGSTGLGPFGTGTLGEERTPIVSLPADPVAAFMLFRILVDPLIASMLGQPNPQLSTATLAVDMPKSVGQTQILLAAVDSHGRATPITTSQPSLLDLHAADAMIQILPGDGVQPSGSAVAALMLGSKAKGG